MKLLGMGLPELLILLIIPLVLVAITAAIGYVVIKAAVKRGIVEAHDEMERRNSQP